MKLSDSEFRAMNAWWRRWGHQHFELPMFLRLGLDVKGKDALEIGCGNGYGGYLLNQLGPKSYIGVDVMEEQIEIARRNYPQYQFLVQDATNLSRFEEASKDVVVVFVSRPQSLTTQATPSTLPPYVPPTSAAGVCTRQAYR